MYPTRYAKRPGCHRYPPLFSEILGSNYGCTGQPVTLHVNAGAASSLLYQWTRNDTGALILSSAAQLTDNPPAAGVYVYTLEVKTPLAGGGFCTSTLTHTVTVVDPPSIVALYAEVDCDPYSVTLHAQVDGLATGNLYVEATGKAAQPSRRTKGACMKSLILMKAAVL